MYKKQKIGTRPAYFDGQLLQAEDFIAEQQYHRNERRRHTLALFGSGVAEGLEVTMAGARTVEVQKGFAIDQKGNEILLTQAVSLEVGEFPPQAQLRVTLEYRDDTEPEREHRNRIDSHSYVVVSDGPDDNAALLIATLQLDGAGNVDPQSLKAVGIRRLRTRIAPGSIEPVSLSPALRTGWVCLPFHGSRLESDKGAPPPFIQGTTEVRSHEKWEGSPNTQGGGGNMPIAIPFGATIVSRFRLAGAHNDDRIEFRLVRGGFDGVAKKHARHILLEKTIKGQPYDDAHDIVDGRIDPAWNTLSLWVRGYGKTSISLVALEFTIGG